MKKTVLAIGIMIALFTSSCNMKDKRNVIGKQTPEIENGLMTPEILWAFGRIGDVQVSPDKTKLLYTVNYYNIEKNAGNSDIYCINTDGSGRKQITKTRHKEFSPKWMNDGRIAFMTNESGVIQMWKMRPDGSDRQQMTTLEGGISEFLISPDGKKVLYVADVPFGSKTVDKYPDLPQATGVIVDDLMYKHWDEWVHTVPHPFVATLEEKVVIDSKDLLENEPYESPMKPFGGIEQLAWSPDSKTIAYTCRKKTGLDYAVSTNSDIYLYDLESGKTRNVSEGMMGYDINPSFSADGRYLAWQSMERDGCESDKNRLIVMDLQNGEKKDLTTKFDQSVEMLTWTDDNKTLFFTSVWHGETQVYKTELGSDSITQITTGVHDYQSVAFAGDKLIAVRHSMSSPNEIYQLNPVTGQAIDISGENKDLIDQLKLGEVKARWTETTDHKQMLSWVIYPPDFDPNKKYPTLLFCEGGPQQPVSQFWSYRWNFQVMAAQGYIIIAPNRRGLYGFGQEWLEQISGDYGGQNMKDYLSAIDDIATEPYVDKDRLGAVGASYGGFSVYWLAGHHEKRFKAFIAHDGMFNLDQQYLETEEMWFVNWDLGGPYWDKKNPAVKRSYENSPHLFVDKWDTPILVIHGEKDYRILASQGMAAFNAAKLRGIPAEMLIYPDENHWVLQPQNAILWQRTFFAWLDRWLK